MRAAVSPWIGREFIRHAYGGSGPYYEGYQHLWADAELWAVAETLGVLQQDPSITQYNAHHMRGHVDNLSPEKRKRIGIAAFADRALFMRRQAAGFPGHGRSTGKRQLPS